MNYLTMNAGHPLFQIWNLTEKLENAKAPERKKIRKPVVLPLSSSILNESTLEGIRWCDIQNGQKQNRQQAAAATAEIDDHHDHF